MQAILPLSLVVLALCSCSDPAAEALAAAEKAQEEQKDQAREVALAWLRAAQAGERSKADALGTEAFREREKSWERSYSSALFDGGFQLMSWNTREIARRDGRVLFDVQAEIQTPEAKKLSKWVRFELILQGPSWRIDAIE
jgi:hypothetical protein